MFQGSSALLLDAKGRMTIPARHRDAAGRITHFSVTTPPGADVVRDLRFVRQSSR